MHLEQMVMSANTHHGIVKICMYFHSDQLSELLLHSDHTHMRHAFYSFDR